MQYMVSFQRSGAVFENENLGLRNGVDSSALLLGPYPDFVQLTYEGLRVGPEGEHIANYADGYWYVEADDSPWSDVVIYAVG